MQYFVRQRCFKWSRWKRAEKVHMHVLDCGGSRVCMCVNRSLIISAWIQTKGYCPSLCPAPTGMSGILIGWGMCDEPMGAQCCPAGQHSCLVCQRERACLAYIRKACLSVAGTQTKTRQVWHWFTLQRQRWGLYGHVLASQEVVVVSFSVLFCA